MVSLTAIILIVDIFIQNINITTSHRRFAADEIYKCILNENIWISIRISQKFVPKGTINNTTALVQGNGSAPTKRQAIIWPNDG